MEKPVQPRRAGVRKKRKAEKEEAAATAAGEEVGGSG
mgnify:CR=1 FL=1